MIFILTKEQDLKLSDWKSQHKNANEGTIGGRYSYEFTPTSLGCIEICKDAITKTQIDLTDYENW